MCEGEIIVATLHEGVRSTGLVIVPGGTEPRFGAHGGLAALADRIAAAGYPVIRFDRRGIGDSSGEDPGFAASGPDLAAAITLLRASAPTVRHVAGFGLCDGATALMLQPAEFDLVLLANPWIVEADPNAPPPAAVRHHYRRQLLSLSGWKRLVFGQIDFAKLVRGIGKAMRSRRSALATTAAASLADTPAVAVLARDDATAVAFEAAWRGAPIRRIRLDTASHSFSDAGEALAAACLDALAKPRRDPRNRPRPGSVPHPAPPCSPSRPP